MVGTVMASRERGGRWLVWHGGAEGWGSAWASQSPPAVWQHLHDPDTASRSLGTTCRSRPRSSAYGWSRGALASQRGEARYRNWPQWLLQHRLQPACIGTARQQNPDCRAPRSFWARWAWQTAFLTSFPGSSWRSETGELLPSSVRSLETEPSPRCAGPWGRHPWLSGFC